MDTENAPNFTCESSHGSHVRFNLGFLDTSHYVSFITWTFNMCFSCDFYMINFT